MPKRVVTITVRDLHDRAGDSGLSGPTTAEQRLALVDALTRETWALTGRRAPTYARADMPGRVIARGSRDAEPPG